MSLKTRVDKAEAQAMPQLLDAKLEKFWAEAEARRKAGQRSELDDLSDEELIAYMRGLLMKATPEVRAAVRRVLRKRGYLRDSQNAA